MKSPSKLAALILVLPPAALAQDIFKTNVISNLNQAASWVDAGGNALPSIIPNENNTYVATWDNRIDGTVGGGTEFSCALGNNFFLQKLKIAGPAVPIRITGSQTLSIVPLGGVDMSGATADFTYAGNFFRLVNGSDSYTINVAAGRKFTVAANSVMNVRNRTNGTEYGTVNFTGEGTTEILGNFNPYIANISAGIVRFNRLTGNTMDAGAASTTGKVSVTGGLFAVNNTSGSATRIVPVEINGGKLGGTGIITAPSTVLSGSIAPGNSTGKLTLGAVTLESGTSLEHEITSAVDFDQLESTVTDGLVLNGVLLKLYETGTLNPYAGTGNFNLIKYAGVLGGLGLDGISVDPAFQLPGKSYTLSESGGFINLAIANVGGLSSFWNTDSSGDWSTAGNWTGSVVPSGASATANLGGGGTPITAPRTVTLDSARTIGTLKFDSGQTFTVAGGHPLTMDDGTGAANISVINGSHVIETLVALSAPGVLVTTTNATDTLRISGVVSGTGSPLAKAGPGLLILEEDCTYTGTTTVGAGTLQVGIAGAAGSLAGPLNILGKLAYDRSSGDITLGQPISGSGQLEFGGGVTYTLSTSNSFSGTTKINAGGVLVAHPEALQCSTLIYNTGGGELKIDDLVTSLHLGGLTGDKSFQTVTSPSATPVALRLGKNNLNATYSGTLTSTSTLTKTGAGTQALQGMNNDVSGAVVESGTLEISGGTTTLGSFNTPTSSLGLLKVSGGVLTVSGAAFYGGGSQGILVTDGEANFNGGTNTDTGLTLGSLIRVDGGILNATTINLGRTGLNYSAEPGGGSTTDGLFINGGTVNVSTALNAAISGNANSSVSVRINAGQLNVAGTTTIGINNLGRWSILDVSGGSFTSSNTETGVIIGGPTPGSNIFLVRGGTATVERLQFLQASNTGTSILHINGGEFLMGAGGMVDEGAPNTDSTAVVRLRSGTLTAKESFTSAADLAIAGVASIKAADSTNTAKDITVEGAVSGSGSVTKQGDGVLRLNGQGSGDYILDISAGTVLANGDQSAASGNVNVNATSTFGGLGSVGGTTIVAPSAKLAPGDGSTPESLGVGALDLQGTYALDLDASSSDIVSASGSVALGAGSVLEITVAMPPTAGSYTIISAGAVSGTFGSVTGLPAGYSVVYAPDSVKLVDPTNDPYVLWATSYSLNGPAALPAADPDGDGVANMLEFMLNGIPNNGSQSYTLVPAVREIAGNNIFTVAAAVRTGITFTSAGTRQTGTKDGFVLTLEASNDLAVWDTVEVSTLDTISAAPIVASLPALPSGWSWQLFTTDGAVTSDARDYFRASVTPAP